MVNSQMTDTQVDVIFKALANSVRREIVTDLLREDQSVADLAAGFSVSAPAISRHLRILEEAKIVRRRRDGRQQWISLDTDAMSPVVSWLHQHGARWADAFSRLETILEDDTTEGSDAP